MGRSGQVLFIYRVKDSSCSPITVHRALHGRREVRTTKDEFGRVVHKTFEYPGTPHRDIIPGVIAVEPRHERRVVEVFKKYRVPYVRARAEGIRGKILLH